MALRKIKVFLDHYPVAWGDGSEVAPTLTVANYSSGILRNNIKFNWAVDGSGNLLYGTSGSAAKLKFTGFVSDADQTPVTADVRVVMVSGQTSYVNLATLNTGIQGFGGNTNSRPAISKEGDNSKFLAVGSTADHMAFFECFINDEVKSNGGQYFEIILFSNFINPVSSSLVFSVGSRFYGTYPAVGASNGFYVGGFVCLDSTTGALKKTSMTINGQSRNAYGLLAGFNNAYGAYFTTFGTASSPNDKNLNLCDGGSLGGVASTAQSTIPFLITAEFSANQFSLALKNESTLAHIQHYGTAAGVPISMSFTSSNVYLIPVYTFIVRHLTTANTDLQTGSAISSKISGFFGNV